MGESPDSGSALVLGRDCFVVLAQALPNGVNARPGVTVLLALDEAMDLDFDGRRQSGLRAVVVAPGCRRRFLRTCRHVSVTVEPGHRLYRSFLAWSLAQGQTALDISTETISELAGTVDLLSSTSDMDRWLQDLLARFGRAGQAQINDKLQALLDQLNRMEVLGTPAQAESVWPAFTALYPGSPQKTENKAR
jgi:hypothetical protein